MSRLDIRIAALSLLAAGSVLTGCDGQESRRGSSSITAGAALVSMPTTSFAPTTHSTVSAANVLESKVMARRQSNERVSVSSRGCHSSYDPCVEIDSDVDCEGGGGDGPSYTGRVRVIGPDVYGLDRDGDGIGCDRN